MHTDKVNIYINKIISERLTKDNELFFVAQSVINSKYGKDIIKKKKFQGVKDNHQIIIAPVYENIEIVSNEIAIVQALNNYAIFSLRDGQQLSQFEYTSAQISNNLIILNKENGHSTIYSLNTFNFIYLDGSYDEFNIKDSSTEYIWAKRNNFFDYLHRESGRIISLPAIIMAYDTEHDMFGLDEYHKVCIFNECGTEDHWKLRQVVNKNGGYLTLHNYTYNIKHIIDIYGNILNI